MGPTILETSLLLAGEAATAYVNNQKARVLCCASGMWAHRLSRFCTTVSLGRLSPRKTRDIGIMLMAWEGLLYKDMWVHSKSMRH